MFLGFLNLFYKLIKQKPKKQPLIEFRLWKYDLKHLLDFKHSLSVIHKLDMWRVKFVKAAGMFLIYLNIKDEDSENTLLHLQPAPPS